MSRHSAELEGLRRQIDELDARLLKLLVERMSRVEEVGKYKRRQKIPPLDKERWQAVIESRLETARSLGLTDDFVIQLFDLIHEYALKIESGL